MSLFGKLKRASTFPLPSAFNSGSVSEKDNSGNSTTAAADDSASTAALMTPAVPLAHPTLKVKRVDYYYSRWSRSWKYKNTGDKITPETVPIGSSSGNDAWQSFCFVVVRKLPRDPDEDASFEIVIKSPYLLQACKHVCQEIVGISWNSDPLQARPKTICIKTSEH